MNAMTGIADNAVNQRLNDCPVEALAAEACRIKRTIAMMRNDKHPYMVAYQERSAAGEVYTSEYVMSQLYGQLKTLQSRASYLTPNTAKGALFQVYLTRETSSTITGDIPSASVNDKALARAKNDEDTCFRILSHVARYLERLIDADGGDPDMDMLREYDLEDLNSPVAIQDQLIGAANK